MILVPSNWRVWSSENWVALKFPHSEWIRVTPVPSFSNVRRSLDRLHYSPVYVDAKPNAGRGARHCKSKIQSCLPRRPIGGAARRSKGCFPTFVCPTLHLRLSAGPARVYPTVAVVRARLISDDFSFSSLPSLRPWSVGFVRDFEMRSHRLFSRKWLHSSVRLIHVSLSAGLNCIFNLVFHPVRGEFKFIVPDPDSVLRSTDIRCE